jgi:RNA polymerase sigma factor (TIGR02999 family)
MPVNFAVRKMTEPVQDAVELQELLASLPPATQTLVVAEGGSLAEMLPRVYDELRHLAASCLRDERPGHTLQPTALVHEAYMRLVDQREVAWRNRPHFLAIAARVMRRVLLQHARARGAGKRGGGAPRVSLDLALNVFAKRDISATELSNTLQELEKLDPRQAQIVELRFFGGLSIEQTAEVMAISAATVKREWTIAKMWLEREMSAK